MAGVYSTRFFEVTGATSSAAFVCPAAHVAVVRSIASYCDGSVAGYARAYVHATYFFVASFQAVVGSQAAEMRQVFYPGEQVGGYTSAASIYMICSGYLFRDDSWGRLKGQLRDPEPEPPPHPPDPE